MTTPKTFEEAIRAALEKAIMFGHGLVNLPRGFALVTYTDLLLCFCKVVWESNEDLRERVAELERREKDYCREWSLQYASHLNREIYAAHQLKRDEAPGGLRPCRRDGNT